MKFSIATTSLLLAAQSVLGIHDVESWNARRRLDEDCPVAYTVNHDAAQFQSNGDEIKVHVQGFPADRGGLFDITVIGGQAPWAPNGNVTHSGWCVDFSRPISSGEYTMDIYSLVDEDLPKDDTAEHYTAVDKSHHRKAISYLINQFHVGQAWNPALKSNCNPPWNKKKWKWVSPDYSRTSDTNFAGAIRRKVFLISWWEVQGAIWKVIDDKDASEELEGSGLRGYYTRRQDCISTWIKDKALADGIDYEPDCGNSGELVPIAYVWDNDDTESEHFGHIMKQVIISETPIWEIEGMCSCPMPTAAPTKGPTEAPTAAPDVCDYLYQDMKCKINGRLFKEDWVAGIGACEQMCEDNANCEYYSYAKDGQNAGMCMGCDSVDDAVNNPGFDFYPVTCEPSAAPTKAPTDPPAPDQPTPGDRSGPPTYVKGDPHFKTFGGEMYDFHGECDLVLVHNPNFAAGLGMDIQIRTKIEDFWSSVESAAMKIGESTMEIRANEGSDEWFWVNGELLSRGLEAGKWYTVEIEGFLIRYKETSDSVREAILYMKKGSSKEHMLFKTFKSFVRVDVDWTNPKNFQGSTGLLGAFDQDGLRVARDGQTFIKNPHNFGQEWQVIAEEPQLFHSYEGAIVGQKCVMPPTYSPEKAASMSRRLRASSMTEEDAEKACDHLVDAEEKQACVFDVLATQDLSMASAW